MPKLTDEEIDAILDEDIWHSAMMHRTDTPETEGAPGCWFGGSPTLPETVAWPTGFFDGVEYSLPFLLQINCRQLPYLEGEAANIPHEGYIFVFFDPPQDDFEKTAKLIYVEEDCMSVTPRLRPSTPKVPKGDLKRLVTLYRHWPFTFIPVELYKLRRHIVADLTGSERDNTWENYLKRMRFREEQSVLSTGISYNLQNYWNFPPLSDDEKNDGIFSLITIMSDQGDSDKPIDFQFGDLHCLSIHIKENDLISSGLDNYFVGRM